MMPDSLPRVTIVTPSYNQGRFIEDTIRSVLDQGYPDLEYIVIDGGSTDQTLDVLKKYAGQLSWFSEPDGGQTDAINKGMKRARGDIVAWLNSDDMYAPGVIRQAVAAFAQRPDVALVYGDAQWLDADGRAIGSCVSTEPFNRKRLLYYSNFICQPTTFFRRKALEEVGFLNEALHYVMDYELWLKLSQKHRTVYLPQLIARVRCYPETKTASAGEVRMCEMREMINSYGGHGLPAFYRLERAAQQFRRALAGLGRLRAVDAFSGACQMFRELCDFRVMRTLSTPQFWRIARMRSRRDLN